MSSSSRSPSAKARCSSCRASRGATAPVLPPLPNQLLSSPSAQQSAAAYSWPATAAAWLPPGRGRVVPSAQRPLQQGTGPPGEVGWGRWMMQAAGPAARLPAGLCCRPAGAVPRSTVEHACQTPKQNSWGPLAPPVLPRDSRLQAVSLPACLPASPCGEGEVCPGVVNGQGPPPVALQHACSSRQDLACGRQGQQSGWLITGPACLWGSNMESKASAACMGRQQRGGPGRAAGSKPAGRQSAPEAARLWCAPEAAGQRARLTCCFHCGLHGGAG